MSRKLLLLVTLILLAAPAVGQEGAVTAVVTRTSGVVTLTFTDAASGARTRPVRLRETVRPDVEVHVPAEGTAALVCSTDHWVELQGPVTWSPDAETCAAGRVLPPKTFDIVRGRRAMARNRSGAQVMLASPRTGPPDDGAPVLLSPRWSYFRESRPTIVWTPVAEARRYEIQLGSFSYRLDVAEAACGPSDTWGLDAVCVFELPSSSPELPAQRSLLQVSALVGDRRWRSSDSEAPVQRLSATAADTLTARHAALDALPVTLAARDLLWADICAEEGLYAEAIALYQKLAPDEPALARLYAATGLSHLAGK